MRKIEGKKMHSEMMGVPAKSEPLMFPSFYINTEYLPEATDWKVGKTYEVKLRIRQTGFSMRKGRDGKENGNADFDIVGIEPKGEIKEKTERYNEDEK